MKLATIKDGSRDGQLAVVARDLKTAQLADGIAATLQRALDDWAFIAPQLRELSQDLNNGRARRSFAFDAAQCMAPLPRAFQFATGNAYVNQLELAHKAAGAELPPVFWDEPLMGQGGSDAFLGPQDEQALFHEAWGIDFGGQLAAITDDVAAGATPDQAFQQIRLLTMLNETTLRSLVADEQARGGGLLQARPPASFAPVAVTPDELGDAWKGGKVHLPLRASVNGKPFGQPLAGVDMIFNFPQLIAHLAKSRPLRAGSIVGAGVVSNKDKKRGCCCIAEQRWREQIAGGAAVTPFLAFGDSIGLEMLDGEGKSVFGAIAQQLRQG